MEAEPIVATPKRKRRWFQFSLRSLMIGVTLLAVACAYVVWQVKIVAERRALLLPTFRRSRRKFPGGCRRGEPATVFAGPARFCG